MRHTAATTAPYAFNDIVPGAKSPGTAVPGLSDSDIVRLGSCILILLGIASNLLAQPADAYRLAESFPKDAQYHVACQVEIAGTLSVPATDKAAAKSLKIAGKSAIQYDERILQLRPDRQVERSVRWYRQLEFERKVGDEDQHSKLRAEAHRLVILRTKQYEVPFCPTAPLLWSEIELVRTDVFVPALQGLFPTQSVRIGDRWRADNIAIQELTDVEKIDQADFNCTLDKVTTLLGRRTAHVSLEGKVRGVGEDGNALHELRGAYYFDLDANFLSYLYVKGTHHLLDKAGNATGKIDGTFVITRAPTPQTREVSDEALRGLTLEPNADNTLLLFEHPQVGARFVYPRNWRVAGFNDKQIGIDESRGSGLLITLSPATSTPNGAQFLQETQQFLLKEQAKIYRAEKPRIIANGMEVFTIDAETAKQRVSLQYYTTKQGAQGATIAARLLPADLTQAQRDVEQIARSLQLRAK